MSKTYDFLKECGVFWVTTINDHKPASRPFGALLEHNGELYIPTSNQKAVYRQFKENPAIQITAIKAETRQWIRIDATVVEVSDLEIKQAMLNETPMLQKKYTADSENFIVLKLADKKSLLNEGHQFIEID